MAWLFAYQPAQAASPKEGLVKAAFIYNFTKLIEWPNGNGSLNICVNEAVDYAAAIQKIEKRSNSRIRYHVKKGVNTSSDCAVRIFAEKILKNQIINFDHWSR